MHQQEESQQQQQQPSVSSHQRMTWLSKKKKSNHQQSTNGKITASTAIPVLSVSTPSKSISMQHHPSERTVCSNLNATKTTNSLMPIHHESDQYHANIITTHSTIAAKQHSRIISATLCKYFGLGTHHNQHQSNLSTNSCSIEQQDGEHEEENTTQVTSSQVGVNHNQSDDGDNDLNVFHSSTESDINMNCPNKQSMLPICGPVHLEELVASGKYGSVWRATTSASGSHDHDDEGVESPTTVAVKVFTPHQKAHYENELEVYSLLSTYQKKSQRCDAVPVFYGAREVGRDDDDDEGSNYKSEHHEPGAEGVASSKFYHLVISYAAGGCMQDYLMKNTITWSSLCKILADITRGLSFLHSELGTHSVVHRDLTSRNILLSSLSPDSMSCMICDFGFAIKLSGMPTSECTSLPEVGTLRYMAPEVLDGAVNLRDCESALKQIDIYSLGLIFWEVAFRCSDLYQGVTVPAYQLPYQRELGNRPTFEKMRVLVAIHKARPLFPDIWKDTNPAIRLLKETIEYCWDHDAEARLTAPCVQRRVAQFAELWQCHKSQTLAALLKNSSGNPAVKQQALAVLSKKNFVDCGYKSIGLHVNNFKDDADEDKENLPFPPPPSSANKVINEMIHLPAVHQNATRSEEMRHPKLSLPLQPHHGLNPCAERNYHVESVEDIRVLEESLVYETAKFKKGPESQEEPPELKNNIIRSQRAANPPPAHMTQAQVAAHHRFADSNRAHHLAHYPLPRVQNIITRQKMSNINANMPPSVEGQHSAGDTTSSMPTSASTTTAVVGIATPGGNVNVRKRKPTHLPQRAARWAKSFVMRTFKLNGLSIDRNMADNDSIQIVYPTTTPRTALQPSSTTSQHHHHASHPPSLLSTSIAPSSQLASIHNNHNTRRHLSLPHRGPQQPSSSQSSSHQQHPRASSVQSHYSSESSSITHYSASPPASPLTLSSDQDQDSDLTYELTPCMMQHQQQDEHEHGEDQDQNQEQNHEEEDDQQAATHHKDLFYPFETIPL